MEQVRVVRPVHDVPKRELFLAEPSDGVLAYLDSPRAHEDDGERTVHAGLSILAAVPRLATPAGTPLAARRVWRPG